MSEATEVLWRCAAGVEMHKHKHKHKHKHRHKHSALQEWRC